MEEWPAFRADGARFSNATFWGRLRNIASQLDPLKLGASEGEVDAALGLLRAHREGQVTASDEALWRAAELKAARVHPDTEEKIPLPLCFAAYTPMQPLILMGMLWPGGSALNQAWWQFYNSSYNASVNFANKNASSPVSTEAMAISYIGSVAASIGLGVGMTKLGKSIKHPRWGPLIAGWAGFFGCVGSGCVGLLLMRRDELDQGVNVADPDAPAGADQVIYYGKSKIAAQEGLAKCCAARFVWNVPATGLAPVLIGLWHATAAARALPPLPRLAVDTTIICGGLVLGIYPGQALFTQKALIPAASLEPEFQNLTRKDGSRIETFFYNKGL